jgi:oligosaccharide repeat unit polymerase
MLNLHSGRHAILALHCAFTVLSGALIPLLANTITEPADSVYAYCVFASAAVLWMLWSWIRVNGTLFDPYGFVLVAVILFNLSHSVLQALGLATHGFFDRFDYATSLQTVGAATLGIMCMHLGAMVFLGGRKPRSRPVVQVRAVSSRGPSIVGGIVVAISIIPAAFQTVAAVGFSMSHSYGASHLEDAAVGLDAWQRILAGSLLPGAFYFLVGRPRSRGRQFVTLACVAVTVLTFFFVGDRSDGTMALIAALWLYEKAVRKAPRSFLVAVIATLLVLYPLVFVTRGLTGGERLSTDVWINALSKVGNPVQNSVVEMGGSLAVLAHVIDLVPSTRSFDFGMSYLSALGSIVPNFSGDLHPSAKRSLSTWLITTIDPYMAAHGGGKGFSVLAEAYVNFGWAGIVVIMWLLGAGLARVTRWADSTQDPAVWAAVACLLIVAPKCARAECLEVVRSFIWYSVALYGACSLIQQKQARRAPTPSMALVRPGLPRSLQIPLRTSVERGSGMRQT